ncbi:hypothetical protein HRI_003149200 [Hibiscus trionum]|uniref:Uncharacterized protein n=1 Tax=Hibiscus trionum TaxID=183268 RepID=A0A9W7IDB4_HIBTR|nr:hypothetical protein HRI_003149200 [Hibiscus trionum]
MNSNIMVWNAQGCGSSKFIRYSKQYMRDHYPDIFVFFETRVSGVSASKVINALGYSNSHRVEAGGFSEGIWLYWSDIVTVEVLFFHFQFILCRISTSGSAFSYLATFFYASPNYRKRRSL